MKELLLLTRAKLLAALNTASYLRCEKQSLGKESLPAAVPAAAAQGPQPAILMPVTGTPLPSGKRRPPTLRVTKPMNRRPTLI